jgi:hypothetical protein
LKNAAFASCTSRFLMERKQNGIQKHHQNTLETFM